MHHACTLNLTWRAKPTDAVNRRSRKQALEAERLALKLLFVILGAAITRIRGILIRSNLGEIQPQQCSAFTLLEPPLQSSAFETRLLKSGEAWEQKKAWVPVLEELVLSSKPANLQYLSSGSVSWPVSL